MKIIYKTICLLSRRLPNKLRHWRLVMYALRISKEKGKTIGLKNIRTRHGFNLKVDMSDWFGQHIYATGEYEPSVTKIIKEHLEPGDKFLDIGSNNGYYALLASICVKQSGKVYCFEPLPFLCENIKENINLNKCQNIAVFSVAAFNKKAKQDFYIRADNHIGTSSLRKSINSNKVLTVDTNLIDNIIKDEQIKIVKIDVEGAECHVLEGMQNILDQHKPLLIIEMTPEALKDMNRTVNDIENILNNFGYNYYEVKYDELYKIDKLSDIKAKQANIFCSHL